MINIIYKEKLIRRHLPQVEQVFNTVTINRHDNEFVFGTELGSKLTVWVNSDGYSISDCSVQPDGIVIGIMADHDKERADRKNYITYTEDRYNWGVKPTMKYWGNRKFVDLKEIPEIILKLQEIMKESDLTG